MATPVLLIYSRELLNSLSVFSFGSQFKIKQRIKEEKVNSLNTAFDVIGKASDTLALVGDSVVNGIASVVTRFFNKRFNKEEDNYE